MSSLNVTSYSDTNPLRIGVMFEAVQLVDIMGVDILGNLGKEYFESVVTLEPELKEYAHLAVPIKWYYISSTLEPAQTTASVRIVPTVTYDDCPRDLDIVITGGPAFNHRPAAADKFMKEAWNTTRTWITTCVGSMWLASSGVLDGHKATTNRIFLETAKKSHPKVEWLDQRWVIEEKPFDGEGKGELWTSGAAGAGIDMIATYALAKYDPTFVKKLALEGLDFDPEARGQFYKD